jgi:hypothetical protein
MRSEFLIKSFSAQQIDKLHLEHIRDHIHFYF